MRRPALVAVALLAVLAALGGACRGDDDDVPTPAVARGVMHLSLVHDGVERTYRQFVPESDAPDGGWPLVLALHGGLGSGDQFARVSGFEELAAREGLVVLHPDGEGRTWDAGACCGSAARNEVDDVGFLAALIEETLRVLPVDEERVFVTGFSNGAMMSFRFGCERPEMVRAVGLVAGSLEARECPGGAGTNLFAFHGDADDNHPIEGGMGTDTVSRVAFRSMADSLARWTAAMGCAESPRTATEGPLTTSEWDGCRDGAKATYVIVAGMDHQWTPDDGQFGGASTSEVLWREFADLR